MGAGRPVVRNGRKETSLPFRDTGTLRGTGGVVCPVAKIRRVLPESRREVPSTVC